MKCYRLFLLIIISANFSLSQVTTAEELKKLKKPELIEELIILRERSDSIEVASQKIAEQLSITIELLNKEKLTVKELGEDFDKSMIALREEQYNKEQLIQKLNELNDSIIGYKRDLEALNTMFSLISDSLQTLKKTAIPYSVIKPLVDSIRFDQSTIQLEKLKNTPNGLQLDNKLYTGNVIKLTDTGDTTLFGSIKNGLKDGFWLTSGENCFGNNCINGATYKGGKKNGLAIECVIETQEISFLELFSSYSTINDYESFIVVNINLVSLTKERISKKNGIDPFFSISQVAGTHSLTEFINGQRSGKHIEYYGSAGSQLIIGNYNADDQTGKWLNHYGYNDFEWNNLLQLDALEWKSYTETNYLNGKKDGVYESYYHGLITTRIYYSNDVYNGNYEEYDADGNLTNLRKYINGRLTE